SVPGEYLPGLTLDLSGHRQVVLSGLLALASDHPEGGPGPDLPDVPDRVAPQFARTRDFRHGSTRQPAGQKTVGENGRVSRAGREDLVVVDGVEIPTRTRIFDDIGTRDGSELTGKDVPLAHQFTPQVRIG